MRASAGFGLQAATLAVLLTIASRLPAAEPITHPTSSSNPNIVFILDNLKGKPIVQIYNARYNALARGV